MKTFLSREHVQRVGGAARYLAELCEEYEPSERWHQLYAEAAFSFAAYVTNGERPTHLSGDSGVVESS